MNLYPWIQVAATVAISVFAYMTWKATRQYARLYGLWLFLEYTRAKQGAEVLDHNSVSDALELVGAEIPETWIAKLQHHSPKRAI